MWSLRFPLVEGTRCEECGFDYDAVDRAELAPTLLTLAARHAQRLAEHAPDRLRVRVADTVWSPLEYACHVRDVLRVQRARILLAQREGTPEWESMRRDERAVEERYNDQGPAAVAVEVTGATDALVATLDGLSEEGWARTGVYQWPVKAVRTVDWVARRTVHELRHHLQDIDAHLGRPASTSKPLS